MTVESDEVKSFLGKIASVNNNLKSEPGKIKVEDAYKNLTTAAVQYQLQRNAYDAGLAGLATIEAELRNHPPAGDATEASRQKYQNRLDGAGRLREDFRGFDEKLEQVRGNIVRYAGALMESLKEGPGKKAETIDGKLKEQERYATDKTGPKELLSYVKGKPSEEIRGDIKAYDRTVTNVTNLGNDIIKKLKETGVANPIKNNDDIEYLKAAVGKIAVLADASKRMFTSAGAYEKQIGDRVRNVQKEIDAIAEQNKITKEAGEKRRQEEKENKEKAAVESKRKEEQRRQEEKEKEEKAAVERKKKEESEARQKAFADITADLNKTRRKIEKWGGKRKE